jgi:general stress protein CsbA
MDIIEDQEVIMVITLVDVVSVVLGAVIVEMMLQKHRASVRNDRLK